MFLNEKALLRLMKSAYKGAGLRCSLDGNNTLTIHTGWWGVQINRTRAGGKLLGQLMEWMRVDFTPGVAWELRKDLDEPQQLERDNFIPFDYAGTETKPEPFFMTDIWYGRYRAVRCEGGIHWFDACALDLVPATGGYLSRFADSPQLWGMWWDQNTGAEVWVETTGAVPAAMGKALETAKFERGDPVD